MLKWLHKLIGKNEAGSSLVELALILPVWLFMLLGFVDIGRGFTTYIALINATRESARWITIHPDDAAGATARAVQETDGVGIGADDFVLGVSPVQAFYCSGDLITVDIAFDHPLLMADTLTQLNDGNSLPGLTADLRIPMNPQVRMKVLYDSPLC
jgi:Flp pilus assembly protein TadG